MCEGRLDWIITVYQFNFCRGACASCVRIENIFKIYPIVRLCIVTLSISVIITIYFSLNSNTHTLAISSVPGTGCWVPMYKF